MTLTPCVSFTFLCDPGHGWLIVSPSWLKALGLTLGDFSECSYISPAGDRIALEEDCDAPRFFKAFEAQYGKTYQLSDIFEPRASLRNWPRLPPVAQAA